MQAHIAIVIIIEGADNLMSGLNAGYEEESRKEDKKKREENFYFLSLLRRVFPPSRFFSLWPREILARGGKHARV